MAKSLVAALVPLVPATLVVRAFADGVVHMDEARVIVYPFEQRHSRASEVVELRKSRRGRELQAVPGGDNSGERLAGAIAVGRCLISRSITDRCSPPRIGSQGLSQVDLKVNIEREGAGERE